MIVGILKEIKSQEHRVSMTPAGVQGAKPGRPWARRPMFSGWKPSTSLSGRMRSRQRRLSSPLGTGNCSRMPSTASSAFRLSMSASSSCWVVLALKRWGMELTPTSAQARSLLRT